MTATNDKKRGEKLSTDIVMELELSGLIQQQVLLLDACSYWSFLGYVLD